MCVAVFPNFAPVYRSRTPIWGHFCLSLSNFSKKENVFQIPKGQTSLLPGSAGLLGRVSSWNASLWCCNLKDGEPFDPSPGFVGYRVFVNRKHPRTSRGEKLKHILLPLWPLTLAFYIKHWLGEKAKLIICGSSLSNKPHFKPGIFSSNWWVSLSQKTRVPFRHLRGERARWVSKAMLSHRDPIQWLSELFCLSRTVTQQADRGCVTWLPSLKCCICKMGSTNYLKECSEDWKKAHM